MARETRRQRRAARAAAGDGAATSRRARAQQVRPSQQPVKQQTGRKSDTQRGQFIRESYAELRKVDWPTRNQTFQGVVVVIIACVIVGAYLWGLDQVIRPVVDKVLLWGPADVPVVCDQHLLGAREQGEDEPRASHR